ncbi:hypothetical protein [Streptomyces sp. NPDC089795]|uniref:hypothetical protein n=1 Tax=Streptomyces sp. NPDC089795 TaxID=3155297 RepID=UPI003442DF42
MVQSGHQPGGSTRHATTLDAVAADWPHERRELAARYDAVALEGCDGTGTHPLARALSEGHGFTVINSPMALEAVNVTARCTDLSQGPAGTSWTGASSATPSPVPCTAAAPPSP